MIIPQPCLNKIERGVKHLIIIFIYIHVIPLIRYLEYLGSVSACSEAYSKEEELESCNLGCKSQQPFCLEQQKVLTFTPVSVNSSDDRLIFFFKFPRK